MFLSVLGILLITLVVFIVVAGTARVVLGP